MKRDDAIARFGHHYTIDPQVKTITEKLNPADPSHDYQFETIEAARAALEDKVLRKNKRTIDEAKKILNRLDTRILVARAKLGLHPRAAKILDKAAEYRAKIHEAEHDIVHGLAGRESIRLLPADIRMPHMLEIGRKIYEVKMNYMTEGIRIHDMRITGIRVYEGWADAPYDYAVHYDAKGKGAHDFSFEYPHDDGREPELKASYGGMIRYFLTEDAAENVALGMMGRLREQFNTLAKDIRDKRHERRMEASAPHYGLDL